MTCGSPFAVGATISSPRRFIVYPRIGSGLRISARFCPTLKTSFSNLLVTRFAIRLDNDAAWTLETDLDRDQDIPARAAWRVWDDRVPCADFPCIGSRPWPRTGSVLIRAYRLYARRPASSCIHSDRAQRGDFAGHDYLDLSRGRHSQAAPRHAAASADNSCCPRHREADTHRVLTGFDGPGRQTLLPGRGACSIFLVHNCAADQHLEHLVN